MKKNKEYERLVDRVWLTEGAPSFACTLLDTMAGVVLILDVEGRIAFLNRAGLDITGYRADEVEGQDVFDLFLPEAEREAHRRLLERVVPEIFPNVFETSWQTKDGGLRHFKWSNNVLLDEEGQVRFIIGTAIDETEEVLAKEAHRDADEALRRSAELTASNELLQTIFDHTQIMVALLDVDMNFVFVNRAYASADKKEPCYFLGKDHFELFPNEENEVIFRRVARDGVSHVEMAKPFDYTLNPERGTTYWDWSLVAVRDGAGVITGILLSLLDVSDRIHAMEEVQENGREIRAMLQEKEVLLREVHHRVKNNLQIISSLLYLHASRATQENAAILIGKVRDRIHTVSLVQEHLYLSGKFSSVDFQQYVGSVVQMITAAGLPPAVKIELNCQLPQLDIDQAMPCGLIFNELVANAVQHAFPGENGGVIRASIGLDVEGQVLLVVEDNGVGVALEEDDAGGGLGKMLVSSLVTQLNGSIETTGKNGTRVEVIFPMI